MSAVEDFNQALTQSERRVIATLTTPRKISSFFLSILGLRRRNA